MSTDKINKAKDVVANKHEFKSWSALIEIACTKDGETDPELMELYINEAIHLYHQTEMEDELRLAADEREVLIQAFDAVQREFEGRTWLMEGRGPYPYNDDRYKQEVRYIFDAFTKIKGEVWKNIKSKSFEYRDRVIKESSIKGIKQGRLLAEAMKVLDDGISIFKGGIDHAMKAQWIKEALRIVESEYIQQKEDEKEMEKDNFNNWIVKQDLDKWHKVDKDNFIAPESSTNIVFFTKNGGIYCGHYKNGFVCYGIDKRELTDVEVTHWRNLPHPNEFQNMLDDMDKK